jgi:hypothetical protein
MAVSRVKTSSVLQGFPKYRSMLGGNAAFQPSNFESIATVTSSGSTGSVTFSSIPSTYTALQLRLMVRCGRAATTDQLRLQLNGDTGANYTRHYIQGNGSTAVASGTTGLSSINLLNFPAATETASIFGTAIIDIQDYQSTTKNTTIRYVNGQDTNATGTIYLGSGLWVNTAAVTSIYLEPLNAASFAAGSVFSLYGIKGA